MTTPIDKKRIEEAIRGLDRTRDHIRREAEWQKQLLERVGTTTMTPRGSSISKEEFQQIVEALKADKIEPPSKKEKPWDVL